MIKIVSVYRGHIFKNSGTPIRIRNLAHELENNPEVDFSLFSWDTERSLFSKHFTLNNNHWEDLKKIYKYVKQNKIDAVIGHTTSASYYLVPLKFFTGAKLVLEMHGLEEDEARAYGDIGFLKYRIFKIWHGFFYLLCDLITTCSNGVTKIVGRWNKNSVSMCGGVDTSRFNPDTASGGLIKKDGKIVIGYAGNARVWQGVPFLLEAYKKIKKQTDDFKLVMLMSERVEVPEGVEVVGPVPNEEVPKFLVDCDILVIPRPLTPVTKVSYPSKITEYLAIGKAVVVSNVGDMDLVIKNGENGLVYEAGNEEQFIKCVLSLKDKNLRNRLGSAAALTAQNMDWSHLGSFFFQKIKEIL